MTPKQIESYKRWFDRTVKKYNSGGIKMNNKLYRIAYKLEQKRRNKLDKKIIEVIFKGETNENTRTD